MASVDFTEDVKLSDLILTRLSEAYRKLRNTFRYLLGNIGDFAPSQDATPGNELTSVDCWILVRAEDLAAKCVDWYKEYAFHKVYRAVYDFATSDLSAIYFDISKHRLYTSGPSSHARRSGQTTLIRLNSALVRLLAPILSYTCEEVWRHLQSDHESVHLAYFPEPDFLTEGLTTAQRQEAEAWERLVPVREQVLKTLDVAREDKVIGSGLEAAVFLKADSEFHSLLQKYAADLQGLVYRFASRARTELRSRGFCPG